MSKLVMGPVRIEQRPVVVGLTTTAYVEYAGLFKDEGRDVGFAVIRPRDDWRYEDFELWIESPSGDFVPCPVAYVIRYRDGGTTIIESAIGEFVFPTPFDTTGKKPTLDGESITVYERV